MKNHLLIAHLIIILSHSQLACAGENDKSNKSSYIYTPESILAKGVDSDVQNNPYTGEFGEARKGIIVTTISNIVLLNKELSSSMPNTKRIAAIKSVMKTILDPLKFTGLFDLFAPLEWLEGQKQPGRIIVVIWYLQKNPSKMTPEIIEKLQEIKQKSNNKILKNEILRLGI